MSEAEAESPAPTASAPAMPGARGMARQLRRLTTQLGPTRALATLGFLVIAVLIARYSWTLPLTEDAERALYDSRVTAMAPRVDQDRRIVMITYTDETLFNTGIRSPVDRTVLAKALANIDRMGAKAIGIDLVFDSPRPEDPVLQAQLRAMNTPTWLAFADQATNPNTILYEQQQFLESYLAEVTTDKTRPTSVRFRNDNDDVIRRWPDRPKGLPPLMANALAPVPAAYADYQGSIRFRLPRRAIEGEEEPVFAKSAIDAFAIDMDEETLAFLAENVRGRYVLIGGDIIDNDQFNTPLSRWLPDLQTGERKTMIGLEVHAHMLAQQLDGAWARPLPVATLWIAALLIVIAGGLTSLIDARARWAALIFLAQFVFLIGFPFWLHGRGVDTTTLPAFGWPLGWLLGYAAVATAARTIGSRQRAFAQSALGKYLPADIANQIMRDPDQLALHGEKREIFCVFTDLEGFTELSHAITPETVARLLNSYLDRLSAVVLDHGGTIDKFVGDAVVAFWGAPIARDDDADKAAAAARAMFEAGELFRREMAEGVPPIGKTRVGLHVGEAIVGNFGGDGRMQYTALGDSMNTASRLESANKALGSGILISREAASRTARDDLVPMGRITLRGRAQPVDVFEPRPDLNEEQRGQIVALVQAHAHGDKTHFVMAATALRDELGQDTAIMKLIERLEQTPKGGSHVLS